MCDRARDEDSLRLLVRGRPRRQERDRVASLTETVRQLENVPICATCNPCVFVDHHYAHHTTSEVSRSTAGPCLSRLVAAVIASRIPAAVTSYDQFRIRSPE